MVNIGGWFNKQHALEVRGYAAFKKEVVTCRGSLETGRWYDVEITCRGDTVGVKMDGKTLFEPVAIPPVTFSDDRSSSRATAHERLWGTN